jgi:hypothetical protein
MIIEESIIGGIISKIINDGTDISKSAIEQAVKKKCKEKSIQCQLYQAIVNTFNYITYNRHTKKQEVIYEAAETVMKKWKKYGYANIDRNIKIHITNSQAVEYKEFLEGLCKEISYHDEFYRQIILMASDSQTLEIHSVKNDVKELKQTFEKNVCGKNFEKKNINYIKNHISAYLGIYLCTNDKMFFGKDLTWHEDTIIALNKIFNISWKESLLTLLHKVKNADDKFVDSMNYIRGHESCELVLQCAKGLLDNYEWKKDDKIHLYEFIKKGKFNKVLIVTGNEGAGKTYFIRKYIKNALRNIENEKKIIIPAMVSINELKTTEINFLHVCSELLCVNLDDIKMCVKVLTEYQFKICFIIDDLQVLGIKNPALLRKMIDQIKLFSRYEEFRWILTLDEHDYYLLGEESKFIRNYVIKKESLMNKRVQSHVLFDGVFSLTSYNVDNKVNLDILQNCYNVKLAKIDEKLCDIDKLECFDTPLMAHIFGQCVPNETVLDTPNTYIEYIKKIVEWKTDGLTKNHQLGALQKELIKILKICFELKDITITKEKIYEAVSENCIKELLISQLVFCTETKESDIFSTDLFKKVYILQNKVFWAVKMIGFLNKNHKLYASELKKFPPEFVMWLVPCYILLIYNNKEKYFKLFDDLFKNDLGAYALFSAQKIDVVYSKILFEYLKQNALMISDARTCYAAMCFTLFSKLKMKEKFSLCQLLEKKIVEYRLEDIYNEIFTVIVDEASRSKNLKKNAFLLSSGRVERINVINGYICGRKYSDLLYKEKKDFMSDLKELVYTIYRNSEVKERLKLENGKTMTFMDCFIRACFEYQISQNPDLISSYDSFIPLFEEDVVVGPFLRKNFTCAAGNYFSRYGKYTLYRRKYIDLV